ncbi:MAG: hypothetical protein ABSD62_12120 [Candidatus Limnocylindrales bacterium]
MTRVKGEMHWDAPTLTLDYIIEAGFDEKEICLAVGGGFGVWTLTRAQRRACFDEVERRLRARLNTRPDNEPLSRDSHA